MGRPPADTVREKERPPVDTVRVTNEKKRKDERRGDHLRTQSG